MVEPDEIVRFYRMIEQAPPPQRADRSGGGTLPARALRYCEALTSATAFGWWIFCPTDLKLMWDGDNIFWCCPGFDDWLELSSASQFPNQSRRFDKHAPRRLKGCSPPFLTRLESPGTLQIWTGLFARTKPNWSLLVRAPANLPVPSNVLMFEGIVEADRWPGPVFINVRIRRTGEPLTLRTNFPLVQIQPLPRHVYSDDTLKSMAVVHQMADFGPDGWNAFESTLGKRAEELTRPGAYSVSVRKRRHRENTGITDPDHRNGLAPV